MCTLYSTAGEEKKRSSKHIHLIEMRENNFQGCHSIFNELLLFPMKLSLLYE